MDPMQPLGVEEAARLLAPLASYPHVALAVSGGPDSLALMQLVHRVRSSGGLRTEITVLSVDHGLRAGSREETLMVAEMAAQLGFGHAILTWSPPEHHAGGLQASARVARYGLMAAYCHAHEISALVTAHHLDDQAETMLMRLKRGSGLDGLAAIPDKGLWAGIVVLRPLLDVPKARLKATLTAEGIGWVDDPSNIDPRFERARVRAASDALVALGLTPQALARSAQRLRRARAALDHVTDDFLVAHSVMSEAGYCTLDGNALASAPDEIALRALARVVEAVGARSVPLRLAKLETMLDALKAAPAKTHTLGGCRIQPLGDCLGVFRETRGSGLPVLSLAPGERALWDNRFRVELSRKASGPVTVKALGDDGFRDARSNFDWLASLYPIAGRTLPSCWRDEVLLFVPELGRVGGNPSFAAQFINQPSLLKGSMQLGRSR
jgi:tRNA(Ile)-lysidine synthase